MAQPRAVSVAVASLLTFAAIGTIEAYRKQNPAPRSKPAAAVPAKPPPVRHRTATDPRARERQVALQWLRGMSLRDQVAQLVIITTYGQAPPRRTKEFKQLIHYVRDLRVGGLIVVNQVVGGSVRSAEPYAMAAFVNRMQRLARVPLLVGADFERGASMRVANTVKYPHLMAYGAANDPALTRELGRATAREARALGVHWVFAPVADVNSNPDNPIINIRSFGEDPQRVAAQVKAFIEGAHADTQHRVLVTAKHFPGHGDTAVDSHMGLASLPADRARMDEIELVPFRAAIEQGVDAVMTAHMAVPALETREIPATVSAPVLTGLLREQLNFRGLVVTDAMDMQGLTKQFSAGEAAVSALEAGADVLLMPTDPDEAVAAVMKAIKNGRLPRQRIQTSVLKVLAAKARVGLHRSKLVDLDELNDELDAPEASEHAQRVAERAVTLVRNERSAVPVANPEQACLAVLAESRYGQQGRAMLAEAKRIAPKMRTLLLDPAVPPVEIQDALDQIAGCERPVIAAFVSVGAYRGNVALAGRLSTFVESVIASGRPVTLVALGSPYLLRAFPGVAAYLATFSVVPPSEIAAIRAVLGEIPLTGKLPVSIPGIAKAGDGLELPARVSQASPGQ